MVISSVIFLAEKVKRFGKVYVPANMGVDEDTEDETEKLPNTTSDSEVIIEVTIRALSMLILVDTGSTHDFCTPESQRSSQCRFR